MIGKLSSQYLLPAAMAILFGTSSASAAIVEVGKPVVFNFSSNAAETYGRVLFWYGILSCNADAQGPVAGQPLCAGTIQVFRGLNGVDGDPYFTEAWQEGLFPLGAMPDSNEPSIQGFLDGEMSMVFTSTIGTIDAQPYVQWERAFDDLVRVDGVAVTEIPEPTSIALLAVGLAGLCRTGRRKND